MSNSGTSSQAQTFPACLRSGLELFENAAATAAGLFTIILMFGPVSGGHFNPVVSLARSKRASTAPAAVGAYIGAAYFFTSSASFANPAISVGRMFSNTFAGIAPASVPGYVAAQLIGGACAILAVGTLYPDVTLAEAVEVVMPHYREQPSADGSISQPARS